MNWVMTIQLVGQWMIYIAYSMSSTEEAAEEISKYVGMTGITVTAIANIVNADPKVLDDIGSYISS